MSEVWKKLGDRELTVKIKLSRATFLVSNGDRLLKSHISPIVIHKSPPKEVKQSVVTGNGNSCHYNAILKSTVVTKFLLLLTQLNTMS